MSTPRSLIINTALATGKAIRSLAKTTVGPSPLWSNAKPNSLYSRLQKQNAPNLAERVLKRRSPPFTNRVFTITYDNGLKFAKYEKMAESLSAKIYFAHPYASWKRGLNKNNNGLIRQYLPKSRTLHNVTEKKLK